MSVVPPELDKALRDAARCVELIDVQTAAFSAKLLERVSSREKPVVAIEIEVVPVTIAEDRFVTEGLFSLKARSSAAGAEPFLELKLRMGAIYRHPSPLPPFEVLEAFAKTNSMVHLWPYFRAFVQQSAAQLAVAPIVLAPFRVTPVAPPTDEAPAAPPSAP